MADILNFPERRATIHFSPEDRAALYRLLDRLRPAGAIGIDEETGPGVAHAYLVGAEGETLIIVRKTRTGVLVESGTAAAMLWSGREVAQYA
ncbi:MAG: hypothetical protein NXI19_19640 [Alphaproteobacteria bacterium]|nr:hypothetical protein [Alphaproteobacteria bacterium]